MTRPWKVLERRLLLDRPWLRVHEERVATSTGAVLPEFHVLEAPCWAAVLALTASGLVVLVEQWRRGLGTTSLELPAGVIDPEESPLDAARRELREETGFGEGAWQPLLDVATEPSRHTNRASFFFARGVVRVGEPHPERWEALKVHLVSVAELLDAVDSGRIEHGVHLGPILLAWRRGWLS